MGQVIQIAIIILFVLLINIFIIRFIILHQKRHNNYLKEKQLLQSQFQQEILKTQLEIQEQTLNTISQEIHDNVGQVLSLTKLNIFTMDISQPEQLQHKINHSKTMITKAIEDLRQLSRSLHGDKIAEIGIRAAIANELNMINNSGRFTTELAVTGQPFTLDPQKEMVLFRIAQEALHNAVKHSGGKRIEVIVIYTPDSFTLRIADDGKSFDWKALDVTQTGIGLKNMLNRANLIGANLYFDVENGKGCSIVVKLPVREG